VLEGEGDDAEVEDANQTEASSNAAPTVMPDLFSA